MNELAWIGAGAADFALACGALTVYAERRHQLLTLLRLRFGRQLRADRPLTHSPRWVSTQPAPNPDRVPTFLAQRVGPYPQSPAGADWNFLSYVFVRDDAPVFLRGRLSDARVCSWSFYSKRHVDRQRTSQRPNSIEAAELKTNDLGEYEICIGPQPVGENWIDTESEAHGVIVLRHYVFRGLTTVFYPAVYWGEVLKLPPRQVLAKSKLEETWHEYDRMAPAADLPVDAAPPVGTT